MAPESPKTPKEVQKSSANAKRTDKFVKAFVHENPYAHIDKMTAEMRRHDQENAKKRQKERQNLYATGYVQFPNTGKFALNDLPEKAREFVKNAFKEFDRHEDNFLNMELYDQLACRVAQYSWLRTPSSKKDRYAEILDTYITVLEHVPLRTEINEFHKRLGTPSTDDFERVLGKEFKSWLSHYFDWQIWNGADREELIKQFHEEHAYPVNFLREL